VISRRTALAAGAVALYALAAGSLAVRAPLWNDELYTWYFAQLPTLGDVWDELSTGVEQVPPAYYVLERTSLWLFGDSQLALRIPSLLGFLLACACLFAVVARRTSAWYGLVAALVPMASGAFPYAWEARPYGLVVGFAAAAVLCHQLRADDVQPRLAVIGLALALAGAAAMHYYGVLVVVPIVFAEAVRASGRRALDRPVVAALAAPLVPLAVSAPLLVEARKYSGAFWTDFDVASAPELFAFLLRGGEVIRPERIPTALAFAFAAILLAASLAVLVRRPAFAPSETAAGAGFVALPFLGVLLGEAVTGAYVERYVLAAALGPALLLPLALHRAAGGRRVAALAALVLVATWFAVLYQYWHREAGVDLDRRDRLIAFLQARAAPGELPVAVAHPHDYLELAHHAPRELAARIIRVSDPERALRYTGSRSTEDGLVVLSDFAPLQVLPYAAGLRRPFLLLRTVRGSEPDWLEPALRDDGARPRVVALDVKDGFTLLRVDPRARRAVTARRLPRRRSRARRTTCRRARTERSRRAAARPCARRPRCSSRRTTAASRHARPRTGDGGRRSRRASARPSAGRPSSRTVPTG
jgi:hypothetical protein